MKRTPTPFESLSSSYEPLFDQTTWALTCMIFEGVRRLSRHASFERSGLLQLMNAPWELTFFVSPSVELSAVRTDTGHLTCTLWFLRCSSAFILCLFVDDYSIRNCTSNESAGASKLNFLIGVGPVRTVKNFWWSSWLIASSEDSKLEAGYQVLEKLARKNASTDQSSSQGQWGPPLNGHQGEADEEYHQEPRPLGFLPWWEKRGQGERRRQSCWLRILKRL